MEARAKGLLEHGNPLGSKARWQVIIVEGILLAGLGIYIFFDKENAGSAILHIISLVLLIASIVGIATEFRIGTSDMVLFSALRAGIGMAIGAVGTANWIWNYIDDRPLRLILGWGLLAYALVHIVGTLVVRGPSINWGSVGMSILTIVLGIILLVNDSANSTGTLNMLATAFVVFGILLIGFGYLRYNSAKSAAA